ncbi:MAG: hypothetical protein ACPGYP_06505 [Solirubrobacterales bacterium]
MRIVHGIDSLSKPGGILTYAATISDVLQRNGHDVWNVSATLGSGTAMLEESAIRWVDRFEELPEDIDIFFAHDAPMSCAMLEKRPDVPQMFFWHSSYFDFNVNPQITQACARIVALWPSCFRRIDGLAEKPKTLSLTQPVDLTRFRVQRPINQRARTVVALSNYLHGEKLRIVERACELAGLEFRLVGSGGEGVSMRPQDAINDADIVLGKGRVIVEAMACGRAAYVYDVFGADGWVTPDTYEGLSDVNFAGSANASNPTAEELATDLAGYSSSMGESNAAIAANLHSASTHTTALVKAAEEVLAEGSRPPVRPDAYELQRLVRVAWRHETEAFNAKNRMIDESLRRGDAEWELEKSRAEVARLQADLAALRSSPSWRITAPLRAIRRIGR